MWRHTESNNLAFLTEVLELKQLVALIAVNNKQLVTAYCTSLCMLGPGSARRAKTTKKELNDSASLNRGRTAHILSERPGHTSRSRSATLDRILTLYAR
jgi:hypothetical protein